MSGDDTTINFNLNVGDFNVVRMSPASGGSGRVPPFILGMLRGGNGGGEGGGDDEAPEWSEEGDDDPFVDALTDETPPPPKGFPVHPGLAGLRMARYPEGPWFTEYSEATDEDGIPYYHSVYGRLRVEENPLEPVDQIDLIRRVRALCDEKTDSTGYRTLVQETHNFISKEGEKFHCFCLIYSMPPLVAEVELEEDEDDDNDDDE